MRKETAGAPELCVWSLVASSPFFITFLRFLFLYSGEYHFFWRWLVWSWWMGREKIFWSTSGKRDMQREERKSKEKSNYKEKHNQRYGNRDTHDLLRSSVSLSLFSSLFILCVFSISNVSTKYACIRGYLLPQRKGRKRGALEDYIFSPGFHRECMLHFILGNIWIFTVVTGKQRDKFMEKNNLCPFQKNKLRHG